MIKKALAIIKTSLTDALTYRGDVFLYFLGSTAHPLIVMSIWLTIASAGAHTPMSREGFIQYYLVLIVINGWISTWASTFLAADIRYGRLSRFLLKPVPTILFQLGNNIAEKSVKSTYLFPFFIILYWLFKVSVPYISLETFFIFLISVGIAFSVSFLLDICVGLAAFWLDDIEVIDDTYSFLWVLFSGQLIPLIAFPDMVRNFANFLPFRYIISFPIEVILGQISRTEKYSGLLVGVLWTVLAYSLYTILWKRGLNKYSAFGA